MPCYDPDQSRHESRAQIRADAQKIHRLTRLLCGLCKRVVDVAPELISQVEDLPEWLKYHMLADAERERAETMLQQSEKISLLKQEAETLRRLDEIREKLKP